MLLHGGEGIESYLRDPVAVAEYLEEYTQISEGKNKNKTNNDDDAAAAATAVAATAIAAAESFKRFDVFTLDDGVGGNSADMSAAAVSAAAAADAFTAVADFLTAIVGDPDERCTLSMNQYPFGPNSEPFINQSTPQYFILNYAS
jgi:hypothetical protein